jgi:hypothetical protein
MRATHSRIVWSQRDRHTATHRDGEDAPISAIPTMKIEPPRGPSADLRQLARQVMI